MVQALFTLLSLATLVFFLVRLSGDPVSLMIGELADANAVQAMRTEMGLNRPIAIQYVEYLRSLLVLDFGDSIRFGAPVIEIIPRRLLFTLLLGMSALLVGGLVGISLGMIAGLKADSWIDHFVRGLVVLGQSTPQFYLGILCIIVFAVELGWLPAGGSGTWRHLVLPALTLSAPTAAFVVRVTRVQCIDLLGSDFIRTARGKGLSPTAVAIKHVLRNAFVSVLTVLGAQGVLLFGGAVVIETVFAWPGIGRLAAEAAFTRDFPLIQASVFLVAVIVLVINLVVDLLYGAVDPRIQVGARS